MPQIPPRHPEEIWNSKRPKRLLLPTAVFYLVSKAGHKNLFPQSISQEKQTHSTKQKDFPSNILAICTVERNWVGEKKQVAVQNAHFYQPPNIVPFSWCHTTNFSYLWILSTDLWIQGMPVTCQHDTTTTVQVTLKQFSNLHQVLLWTDCFVYAWSLSL